MLIEVSKKRGVDLPEKVANAPELLTGLEMYFVAFTRLNTCRQIGFSFGPIPWTAIREYAFDLGLDDEGFDKFLIVIQEMDSVYLNWVKNNANSGSVRK